MADRPVLALYRRYRPDTFGDIIGQDHVIAPLTAAITKGRVNHAYLFSGPRGCGKTTSARVLARSLNCAQGPTATPCGRCGSCVDLARGGPGSLDVIEIDAASHRGIDDARDLRDRVTFAPVRDRYKVVIIDEAHQITNEGFNALLKVVEEPPEHVVFVFATTEPEKVLGTIRSRTHHFPFRLVPPRRLMPYLEQLCDEEGVAVAGGALGLVLRAGGGSVRDTLSVLDQLIAGAGPAGVDLDAASDLLGYVPEGLLDDIVDALAAVDGAAAFGVVHRAVEGGHDPRRFALDLLERLRALVIVSRVGDSAGDVLPDQPPDAIERLRTQAGRFGVAELSRAADTVATALADMAGATSPRLLLELLVARLLVVSTEAGAVMAARLDRLERQAALVSGAVVPPLATATQPASGAPAPQPAAVPGPAVVDEPASARTTERVVDLPPADRTDAERIPGDEAHGARPAVHPPVGRDAAGRGGPAAPDAAHPDRVLAGSPPAAPVPASPAPPAQAPTGISVDVLRRSWDTVTEALRDIKRATWGLVKENAQVIALDERTLTLGFVTQGLSDTFNNRGHGTVVREALVSSLGVDRTVLAVVGPRSGAGSAAPGGVGGPGGADAGSPGTGWSGAPTITSHGGDPEPPPDWDDVEPVRPILRRSPPVSAPADPAPAGAAPVAGRGTDAGRVDKDLFDRAHGDQAHGDQGHPDQAHREQSRHDQPHREQAHHDEPQRDQGHDDPRHDSVDAPPDGAHGAALVERLLGGRVISEE